MFVVEKIVNDNIVLENMDSSEKIHIGLDILPNVKESDIIILNNGKYEYSEYETEKRKNKIKNLKSRLKIKE